MKKLLENKNIFLEQKDCCEYQEGMETNQT